MSRGAIVATPLALLFVTHTASAQELPVPFRVEYAEASACVEDASFTEQLLARSARVSVARPEQEALRFSIDVRSDGAVLTGVLTVHELDGTKMARGVPGATCDEVIAAMALIAAVLVDPNANVQPLAPPKTEAARPAPPEPAPPPASATREKPRPRATRSESSVRWTFGGLAALAFEGAVAPGVAPGLSLGLELGVERSHIVSPLFVLSGISTFPTRETTSAGVARFQWAAFRASACPVRWPPAGRWALRPCAFFELGRLIASGEQTDNPDDTTVVWTAAGSLLRGEVTPFEGALLALEGGFVAPFLRDTFYFDPRQTATAFVIPAIGATARAGIGVRF